VAGGVARFLFEIHITGIEHLAAPGRRTILAALPHRNWSEPLLLSGVLPGAVGTVLVADGPTIERSRIRLELARLIGRVLPVWPESGPQSFAAHLDEARHAIATGNVLVIFPETGPPVAAPRLRRISPSIAWFAAETGAQVVPLVIGGTDELYLRRRIEMRVLAPFAPLPPAALESRAAVVAWMRAFRDATQAVANEVEAAANAHPPRRKHWRWLTGHYPRATTSPGAEPGDPGG
jgi:1-acyl-sn-glycerol-3-phosphate acyltransferase